MKSCASPNHVQVINKGEVSTTPKARGSSFLLLTISLATVYICLFLYSIATKHHHHNINNSNKIPKAAAE
ncbi:Hypothetical predicted protein [Octopus vulgaris]|uniref:Uncharacterized protein n=1 Tax=Octopus vulgaris TaxID=6645 RepID=A0AA36AHZ2_OCTVU|nr:Hypothetical predicted protein [Octopus vulgaris]